MTGSTGGDGPIRIRGLQGSARALAVSIIFLHDPRTILLVCPTEKEAQTLHRDMVFFLGEEKALLFPAWDIVSTDMFSFQRESELLRIEGLCRLIAADPAVIVVPAAVLVQKLIARETFAGYVGLVSIGDVLEREILVGRLLEGGYRRTTLVETKGEFSIRGHIVDLFPPTLPRAIRIEFIGDEIESIREFDPATQRSTGERVDFVLTPAREILLTEAAQVAALQNLKARSNDLGLAKAVRDRLAEKIGSHLVASINPLFFSLFSEAGERRDSLFSYLAQDSLLVLEDETGIARALENLENEFSRFCLKARAEEKFFLDKESVFLPVEELDTYYRAYPRIVLEALSLGVGDGDALSLPATADLGIRAVVVSKELGDASILAPAATAIQSWLQKGVQRDHGLCRSGGNATHRPSLRGIRSFRAAVPGGTAVYRIHRKPRHPSSADPSGRTDQQQHSFGCVAPGPDFGDGRLRQEGPETAFPPLAGGIFPPFLR